jgi:hypothetical protein
MKIKDIAVLSILLVATSLVAADVEFTRVITPKISNTSCSGT